MAAPISRPLIEAWKVASEGRANAVFHQVLAGVSIHGNTFSVTAVLRNAIRYADGIKNLSKLKAGDRVAMLADGFGEVVPLYYAFWLLGITVVAIPNTTAPEVTVAHINNAGCRGLIYSPALAARLASVLPKVSGIDFWLLVGVGRSGPLGSGGKTVTRLEDLLQNGSRNAKLEDYQTIKIASDSPLLIAFTSGETGEPKGVGFTERALITAANNQKGVYSIGTNAERCASLLPDKHIVSIIHNIITPLVAPVTSVVLPEIDPNAKPGALVEELYDNQVHALWMHEDRLEDLRTASKSQKFVLAKNFKVFLIPRAPVSLKMLDGVGSFVVPCYAQTEAGGVVAVGKKGELMTSKSSTVERIPILSSGSAIPGVTIRVVASDDVDVKIGETGELTVQSHQNMVGYMASAPGSAYVTPDNALHTGDRVQPVIALDGSRHFVVLGRDDQFVVRNDKEVNIFELESVIKRVVGVKDVRVVGFHHNFYGKELGAFVLLQKKANITREVLWSNLLAFFPWELVPKIFMIADCSLVPQLPTRIDIEDKLAKFASSDFSKPPPAAAHR